MATKEGVTQAMPSAEVDAYLASVPADARAALEALRRTIEAVVPDPGEMISYQLPTITYRHRPLVSFGARNARCAFYVRNSTFINANRDAFAAFDTSKGTIRFRPDHPIPDDLVERIVLARMAETEAGS
jgi:uncharacterized protein YdhG (YjbR/CyaY superfamily)